MRPFIRDLLAIVVLLPFFLLGLWRAIWWVAGAPWTDPAIAASLACVITFFVAVIYCVAVRLRFDD